MLIRFRKFDLNLCTGKLIYWYLGEKSPNREMNQIFIKNLHTLAVEDENLREKYKKLISIDLIPEVYKANRNYYVNDQAVYPDRHQEPKLFKNNLKLKKKVNLLFNKDISSALVDQALLEKLPKKAYFIIYECDQVKDDGLIFAKRLELAGIEVKVIRKNIYFNLFEIIEKKKRKKNISVHIITHIFVFKNRLHFTKTATTVKLNLLIQ